MLKNQNIKDEDMCLVLGLGNEKSTPDSLGPLVVSKTLVTNYIYLYGNLDEGFRRVCAISPGVMGETGIETSDLLKSIVDTIKPNFVITIDALAASSVERVNKTIRDFDSFKLRKLHKPLKNGYFFVKFQFLILRNLW